MGMTQIDWNGKLEAVHEDGRVAPVEFDKFYFDGDVRVKPNEFGLNAFNFDGRHSFGEPVSIRNVATPAEVEADVEWGPEIKVDGKRPEWLGDGDEFQWTDKNHENFDWWRDDFTVCRFDGQGFNNTQWDTLNSIRLPANHPHYRTEKPVQAGLGVLTGMEHLERMEALVRRMASDNRRCFTAELDEARAIVALLPEPVDPDLVRAREIAFHLATDQQTGQTGGALSCIKNGEFDEAPLWGIPRIMEAIKLGRELERESIKAGREMGR